MKAALGALALALSATIAMAQDSGQLTPEQTKGSGLLQARRSA
jgi:hypothetical protein